MPLKNNKILRQAFGGILIVASVKLLTMAIENISNTSAQESYRRCGAVYTIGSVLESRSNSPTHKVKFHYNNKIHEYWTDGQTKHVWGAGGFVRKGEKVYVLFPRCLPKRATIFKSYKLPPHMQNIQNIPKSGWTLEELQKLDTLFDPDDHYEFYEPRLDAK